MNSTASRAVNICVIDNAIANATIIAATAVTAATNAAAAMVKFHTYAHVVVANDRD